ncbi:hypothetical protein Ahy_B04g073438 [Arachis hypogaea]|uniref:Uncharacterized protein n=1 Tax=Arachis hypogaea TaxID=3818 RepID=A0A444ZQP8_ARAHY|nr:hypothetical protein Ahy_B04g073438 [Arachis hypogaea]
MTTDRGVSDQATGYSRSRGRGRGRVSSNTPETSGYAPSILTTPLAPNNNECTQEITNIIKLMYDHPWPNYKKIPAEIRERWFQKWALHFRWNVEHDLTIGKIFDCRMGRCLQQMLDDVRQGQDHLTTWPRLDIKKGLLIHWETDEGFRHRRLTNRVNKASARSSKYIGVSAIFMKTKAILSKSLDNKATLADTFNYTHTLKKNKERVADQRSQDHYSQQSGPDAVWYETASASYKNRVYGLGSFFASSICTSTLRPSSGSATSRVQEKRGFETAGAEALIQPSLAGLGAEQLLGEVSGVPHSRDVYG